MKKIARLLTIALFVFSVQGATGLSGQQTQTAPATPPHIVHHTTPAHRTPPATPAAPSAKQVPLSNHHHYTNSDGKVVHSPAKAPSVPQGGDSSLR